jgi:hypothetical protein
LEGRKQQFFMKPSCNSGKRPAEAGKNSFGGDLPPPRSIISDGRQAPDDPSCPPEAFREVHKALKRWRALLRLLAHPGEQVRQ